MDMKKEQALHLQIRNRLKDYLIANGATMLAPELTVCPHCGELADIILDYRWRCSGCGANGDVVDYVMAQDHLTTNMAAIKHICRVLQIKITTLDVISAEELLDKQFDGSKSLVEKFLGKGLCLMSGSPKIGKSWLALFLAHKVSLGEPLWEFKTTQSEVVYISLEDTEERIQARLAKISGGETGKIWIATEAELIGLGFEEQITNLITEHPSVRLIIVDTFQRIRQLEAKQYSYAGDYGVINCIKSLADRFGVTILLVHHTRKAGAADPFAMVSGTTGLTGGVDGLIVLIKDERMDNRAKLYATGRDILDLELDLLFDRDSAEWKFLGYGGKERVEKRDCLLSEINDFLADNGQYHGTASALLDQLSARAELRIKSPNALTRLLNPQRNVLKYEYGILYDYERTSKERIIHLTRCPDDDNDDTVPPV